MQETKRMVTSATVKLPIYLRFTKQGLSIVFGKPPRNIRTDKRITKKLLKDSEPPIRKPSPLAEAIRYAEIAREPSIVSKAQIARRFSVSRARVCQMLNLLDLDHRIVNYLWTANDVEKVNYFSERRLRPLTRLPQEDQLDAFKKLLQGLQISGNCS